MPLSQEEGKALWDLLRDFEEDDRDVREDNIRRLKKLEYFWHGYHFLVQAGESAFFTPELNPEEFEDQDTYYTKVINVFRAHGEAVIAALTVDVPSIHFPPDDADLTEDVEASKAYNDISKLIQIQNKGKLTLIKTLFILFHQNFAAGYVYEKEDKKAGTYNTPKYEEKEYSYCPNCDAALSDNLMMSQSPQTGQAQVMCPECNQLVEPVKKLFKELSGFDTKKKKRVCLDVFGPFNVFIPHSCRTQDDVSILRLSEDVHYTKARYLYPDNADEIKEQEDPDYYERWARQAVEFKSSDASGLVTRKSVWYRSSSLYGIGDKEMRDSLLKRYPDGIRAVFVNDILVDSGNEDLDDVWAITYNPLSNTIYSDPIGKPLVPVNELINTLTNLSIQTVEHGIPETFADPDVLDFTKYKNSEATPGSIFPAKPRLGKTLGESFETIKTATLSQEIKEFATRLEQIAQFVVGSFPSIYGGALQGSRTAAEYSMSRNQALQRLSIPWVVISNFWAELITKATVVFANEMIEDVKYSEKTDNGYVSVYIKKASLTGRVGSAQPEVADKFPISWSQKRDIVMELMQMNSPEITAVLAHPENAPLVKNLVGLSELYIPGSIDRMKQTREIDEMLSNIPSPDQMGGQASSLPIEQELDNHEIHIDVCKSFLNSDRGQMIKQENPEGYQNVVLHLQQHLMVLQQQAAPQMGPEQQVDQNVR